MKRRNVSRRNPRQDEVLQERRTEGQGVGRRQGIWRRRLPILVMILAVGGACLVWGSPVLKAKRVTLSVDVVAEDVAAADPSAVIEEDFLRGMTVSCPGFGRIWGSPAMAEALDEIRRLGVGWVAIHPYAQVSRDGRVRYRPAASEGYLRRAVELAREAGVQMFWKPHLAYWGSFEWRGKIRFDRKEHWDRFFTTYRDFVVDQARFAEAAGIPLFSVGLEYEETTGQEAQWREILAAVRAVYSGRVTYSANWDRLDNVPFWDAVDLIGVQGYFPLSDAPNPSRRVLKRGWDEPLNRLRAMSKHYGKPVLFAEIGYDLSPSAASKPWLRDTHDTPASRALRLRLMEVALERLENEDFVEGMFWWKWIPRQRHVGDFSMLEGDAQEVLRKHWGSGKTSRSR